MKKVILLFVFVSILFLEACISSPMQSILFTNTDQHVYGHSNGNQIGSGKVVKFGESCSQSTWLLDIVMIYYGSGGSIETAVKSAGIKKIAVVDRSSLSILGPFVYTECVIVWGE